MKRKVIIFVLILAMTATYVGVLPASAAASLTVSSSNKQEFKGWGVFPAFIEPSWSDPYDTNNTTALDYIYKDLNADIYRVDIIPCGNSDGSIQTDRIYYIERALKAMTARGKTKWYGAPWTPPTSMKTINSVSGAGPNHLREDKEAEFCKYIVNVFKYLHDQKGLPWPVAFSIQNELAYATTDWPGCVYTRDQWIRVAKMMRAEFDKNGLSFIPIIGSESSGFNKSESGTVYYLGGTSCTSFVNDPALEDAVAHIASHSYSTSSGSDATAMRDAIRTARTNWGKDAWMTEIEKDGTDDTDIAINQVQEALRDIVYCEFNYFFHWLAYHDNPEKWKRVLVRNTTRTKLYYALKELYNLVDVENGNCYVRQLNDSGTGLLTYNTDTVDTGAFITPNNMTVVLVNDSTSSKAIDLDGLTGTSARISRVSSTENAAVISAEKSISNGKISGMTLPADSITFVYTNAGYDTFVTPTPTPTPISTTIYEAEDLTKTASDTTNVVSDSTASGGSWVSLVANTTGDYIQFTVNVTQTGTYNVKYRYKAYNSRGKYQLSIGGTNQGSEVDQYASSATWREVDLGNVYFSSTGSKTFKFSATGKNSSSSGYTGSVDYIKLTKQ